MDVPDRPQFIKKSLQSLGKHSLALVIPAPWLAEMGCTAETAVFLEFDGKKIVIEKAVEPDEANNQSS